MTTIAETKCGSTMNEGSVGERTGKTRRTHIIVAALIVACVLIFLLHNRLSWLFSGSDFGLAPFEKNAYVSFDISPDGTKLIFSGAGKGGNKDLYLLNLQTWVVTRLTDTDENETDPAFSPDGRQIAYISAREPDQPHHLFLRSLDGTQVKLLASSMTTADSAPSFSHDGRRIVFARAHTVRRGARGENPWTDIDVYIVNVDGSGLHRLTTEASSGTMRPKFFPDDRHVLFEQTFKKPNNEYEMHLASVDADAKEPIQTFPAYGQNDSDPSFFPDKQHIVFVSDVGGRYQYDLCRIKLDGSGLTCLNLTRRTPQNHHPVVTPDGKHIFYLQGYEAELWEVNSDGSNAHRIATSALVSNPLHWKPGM